MSLPSTQSLIDEFERLIRRDPGQRGLLGKTQTAEDLCLGHLHRAASDLAQNGRSILVATGFFIPHGQPPAAETDGPLGTMLLAASLRAVGYRVTVVTDHFCGNAITAAAAAFGLPAETVRTVERPDERGFKQLSHEIQAGEFSHLIAIERVGPSHDEESLRRQSSPDSGTLKRFLADVPQQSRGRCHNMRGDDIEARSGPIHELFDLATTVRHPTKTIGIGDGGNEIGMGSIPWEQLRQVLTGPHGGRIICRIPTNWTILAGTSNWGGYALAAATLLLRGETDALAIFDSEFIRRALMQLVITGPAVDGVTGLPTLSVDAIPFLTYIQPWIAIRGHLNLPNSTTVE